MVQTLSPTVVDLNQKTYQRLKAALELSLRRQIFIAVCDDLHLRDRLAIELEDDLSGHVSYRQSRGHGRRTSYPHLVTLTLDLAEPDPIAQISQWLRKYPPPVTRHNRSLMPAFQILGIERLSRQPASLQWLFLNYLRSIEHSLPALESSLLLWVTRPWSRMIPQSAPDFWRCRTAVFDFIGEPTPLISTPETFSMGAQQSHLHQVQSRSKTQGEALKGDRPLTLPSNHREPLHHSNGHTPHTKAFTAEKAVETPVTENLMAERSELQDGVQSTDAIQGSGQHALLHQDSAQPASIQQEAQQHEPKTQDLIQQETIQQKTLQQEPTQPPHIHQFNISLDDMPEDELLDDASGQRGDDNGTDGSSHDEATGINLQPPSEEELAQAVEALVAESIRHDQSLTDPLIDDPQVDASEDSLDSGNTPEAETSSSVTDVGFPNLSDEDEDFSALLMPPLMPLDLGDDSDDTITEILVPPVLQTDLDLADQSEAEHDDVTDIRAEQRAEQANGIQNTADQTSADQNTTNDDITAFLMPPTVTQEVRESLEEDGDITDALLPPTIPLEEELDIEPDAEPDSELKVFDAEPHFLKAPLPSDPSMSFRLGGQAVESPWLNAAMAAAFQSNLKTEDPAAYAMIKQIERLKQKKAAPNVIAGTYRGLGNLYRDRIEQGDISPKNLLRAMKAYEQVMQYVTDDSPVWSEVLNDMGNLCWLLSRCAPSPEEGLPHLQQGIQAYRMALGRISPHTHPQTYPMIQNNLGAAYGDLARYHNPVENLQQSVNAYQEALRYRKADIDPMRYASTQNNLGTTYWNLAQYQEPIVNLKQAIAAYTQSLQYYQPQKDALNYAMIQNNLGTAYWNLAQHEHTEEWLRLAIEAYTIALRYRTLETNPVAYAATQNNLGTAYWHISGYYEEQPAARFGYLSHAVTAYKEALKAADALQRGDRPMALNFDVLATCNNLGLVQYQIATDHELSPHISANNTYLEDALDQHLLALQGWQGQPNLRQTALKCVLQTLKAIFNTKGLVGQNQALSKIPASLLPEILPQL